MKKIGVSVLLVCTLLVCTVSPIFADNIPSGYRQMYTYHGRDSDDNHLITMYVTVSSYKPYVKEISGNYRTFAQDYNITITIANDSDNIVIVPGGTSFTFNMVLQSSFTGPFGYEITDPPSNDYSFSIVGTNSNSNSLRLAFTEQYYSSKYSTFTIAPHYRYQFSVNFTRTYTGYSTTWSNDINNLLNNYDLHLYSLTFSNPTMISTGSTPYFEVEVDNDTVPYNTSYLTYGIFSVFHNADPASGELISNSESATDTIQSQHTTEQSYYSANAQAIESTGLSNFQYSNSQVTYFQGVLSDFQSLWDSLGEWTFIYTFTLMLSFATFVLRHRPHTRSSTKSSGGDKNAGS